MCLLCRPALDSLCARDWALGRGALQAASLGLLCTVATVLTQDAHAQAMPTAAAVEDIVYISPPMDINYGTRGDAHYSDRPMELRIDSSVGLFGSRRSVDPGLLRMHEGVDLRCRAVHSNDRSAENVYAVAAGQIIAIREPTITNEGKRKDNGSVMLQHYPLSMGVVSYYKHLGEIEEGLRNAALPEQVRAGERIGRVLKFESSPLPTHLHYELRRAVNRPLSPDVPDLSLADQAGGTFENTVAIDPTRLLYDWEVNRFKNDAESRKNHIEGPGDILLIDEVVRGRMLRFFYVRMKGGDFYLPLYDPTPAELSMIATLRVAFMNRRRVRLAWRDSLFFGKRRMIVEVQTHP